MVWRKIWVTAESKKKSTLWTPKPPKLFRWNRYLKLSSLRSNFCPLKVKKAAFKKGTQNIIVWDSEKTTAVVNLSRKRALFLIFVASWSFCFHLLHEWMLNKEWMYLQGKKAYILTETHFGEVLYSNDSSYVSGGPNSWRKDLWMNISTQKKLTHQIFFIIKDFFFTFDKK